MGCHLVGCLEVVQVLAGEQVEAGDELVRLLQEGLRLLADLHKRLLHLHRVEAVLRRDDVLAHLRAVVLARYRRQPVHRPAHQTTSRTMNPCMLHVYTPYGVAP